jgi:hypothetical protein
LNPTVFDTRFRYIVLVALGLALAGAYRRGWLRNAEDLEGWQGFLTVWLPAAILLGLGVAFAWPWAVGRWTRWRRRR